MRADRRRDGTAGQRTKDRRPSPDRRTLRHSRTPRRTVAAGLWFCLFALPAGGCAPDPPGETVLSDATYVTVIAHLSLIQQELERPASERADSARRAVLETHGVEAEDLRAYARVHGDDPEHMAAIWRSVRDRVDELREEWKSLEDPIDAEGNGEPSIRPLPADAAEEQVL